VYGPSFSVNGKDGATRRSGLVVAGSGKGGSCDVATGGMVGKRIMDVEKVMAVGLLVCSPRLGG
jgi:hypothetical protein